jgi:prevent-host-death family protein
MTSILLSVLFFPSWWIMKTVGLFEAKQKLSELVERASEGEKIGITRRGKLAAILNPAKNEATLKEAFAGMARIRKRAKPLPKGVTIKDLIEEGRR